MPSLVTASTHDPSDLEPQKPNSKAEFARWANNLREVTAMRLKATGRGGAGGGVQWWERLPESFRLFLLSTIAVDDWERYADARWDALPDGLRSVIALECRKLGRAVEGCPWH